MLKRKYGLCDIDTLEDIVQCIYNSSSNHFNLAKPTVDPKTGERRVI